MACLLAVNAIAQDKENRGYISITMGLAFPLGDFADGAYAGNPQAGGAEVGLNINLINFGYSFGKGIGVTASWFGGAHSLKGNFSDDTMWSYGGLFAGPMYTFTPSEKICIDLKVMIGFVYAALSSPYNFDEDLEGTTSGFLTGATFRFNFARRWAFITHADVLLAKPMLQYNNVDIRKQKIAALNINPGIAFRL
jgi:hypothetical protein